MKLLVVDIPADKGGALTILDLFYEKAIKDTDNQYVFLLSVPKYKHKKNVEIRNYEWTKKSWFHQIFFNYFLTPKIIKDLKPDQILSLQNHQLPFTNIYQTVYLQNVLPFADYKFKLFDSPLLWFYQNIYGTFLKLNLKTVDKLIVQSKWMKDKMVKDLNLLAENIEVDQPILDINVKKYFNFKNMKIPTFFYPASALEFKNHQLILDACLELFKNRITNFKVIFTIDKDENKYAKKLNKFVCLYNLPVEFIGFITKEEVYELYSKSILVYPSLLESFGLPIYEAMLFDCSIIAINKSYVNNINFNKLRLFNNVKELKKLMINFINI